MRRRNKHDGGSAGVDQVDQRRGREGWHQQASRARHQGKVHHADTKCMREGWAAQNHIFTGHVVDRRRDPVVRQHVVFKEER